MSTLSPPKRSGRVTRTRQRPFTALLGVTLLLAALTAAGLYAYDRNRTNVIASGVTVGGIDVGGLSRATAARKIRAALAAPLARTVTVRLEGHSWRISAHRARLTVNTGAVVEKAIEVSRGGSFISRAVRDLVGGGVRREISIHTTYSHAVIRALATSVGTTLDRSAQDASIHPSPNGLTPIASRAGLKVQTALLAARIGRALTDASAQQGLDVPALTLHPKVSTKQLAAAYPAYILVDRATFTLRFYDHLKLTNSYPIAVGMQGLQTPAGLYHIQWEQVNPPWYVPHDAWTGSLAGKVIPPGPQDPLKARFMSFDGGAGIHGIDPSEYSSIGHNASHGCIRMTIPAVIDLYSKSPVGTPVYIV